MGLHKLGNCKKKKRKEKGKKVVVFVSQFIKANLYNIESLNIFLKILKFWLRWNVNVLSKNNKRCMKLIKKCQVTENCYLRAQGLVGPYFASVHSDMKTIRLCHCKGALEAQTALTAACLLGYLRCWVWCLSFSSYRFSVWLRIDEFVGKSSTPWSLNQLWLHFPV